LSKFLIAGLGNIGEEYSFTRHNIGFEVADAFSKSLYNEDEIPPKLFSTGKYASVYYGKFKGKQLVIIKPTTYMNLSGKAINYWMQEEKIAVENILIITDDLALPFGSLRLKKKGSDGGHNGLNNIAETLNTIEYPRLRFGIGSNFGRGQQVNYVLERWNEEEQKLLPERIQTSVEIVKNFIVAGIDRTMTAYNKK